jgi:2-methylcitrate dehydratase PrpD
MEFLAEGAWTKRIHPGLAAQNGMHAALLAAEGFIGPSHILEGRDGFLHGYSRDAVPERLTANLGKTYEILHTAVKPHACCRYMQGPIDAVLDIVRQEALTPERIKNIEMAVLQAGWGLVADPLEKKYNPQSIVDAQFSMPFGAAVAAVRAAAGLDQFTLDQIRSSDVGAMMQKVKLVKDPRIEETYPHEWPAHAVIETVDGMRYERFVRHPKGDPENPLSWAEMAAKFHALTGALLSKERRDKIVAEVSNPNATANVAALCASA